MSIDGPFNTYPTVLQDALPHLQHLSSLHLGGIATQHAVLTVVQQLPRLQELVLLDSACQVASFAALPQSLTKLRLELLSEQAFRILHGEGTTANTRLAPAGQQAESAVVIPSCTSLPLGPPYMSSCVCAFSETGNDLVGLTVFGGVVLCRYWEVEDDERLGLPDWDL